MRNQSFYVFTALTLLLAALAAVIIQNISGYLGLLAGITVLSSTGFYELAIRKASRTSKDQYMKITIAFVKPFYEILILTPILVSMISLNISNPLFQYLAISVIGTVLLSQLIEEKIVNRLRETAKPRLGQRMRLGTIVLTLFLSSLNQFYIFYGALIVGIITVYDLFDMTYRAIEK